VNYRNDKSPYYAAGHQQPYYSQADFEADGKGHWVLPESDCCASKLKCPPTKECVQTYKCLYKLYKISQYHLYKVCPCCNQEYDYHYHLGICPFCGQ